VPALSPVSRHRDQNLHGQSHRCQPGLSPDLEQDTTPKIARQSRAIECMGSKTNGPLFLSVDHASLLFERGYHARPVLPSFLQPRSKLPNHYQSSLSRCPLSESSSSVVGRTAGLMQGVPIKARRPRNPLLSMCAKQNASKEQNVARQCHDPFLCGSGKNAPSGERLESRNNMTMVMAPSRFRGSGCRSRTSPPEMRRVVH
jgi:hypothetical protein